MLVEGMFFFERSVGSRSYRLVAQSLWDPVRKQPYSRQAVLGPAGPPPHVDLAQTKTVGQRRIGDVGALVWVAEQLDLVNVIDRACGAERTDGPSIGEMVLAVALQRVCEPGAKRDLTEFLEGSLPRASCLKASAFSGQAFYRVAQRASVAGLDAAQIAVAETAVRRFGLSVDVLAFDTTNFDTFIATTTPGELARRGHAKSKRADLRVVGLAVLASETGHVPLLHRTYAGNAADQTVLTDCLSRLGEVHDALGRADGRGERATRTLVRDGGSWSEQLELHLDVAGYYTLISLPLGHGAAKAALQWAAQPRKMKALSGKLRGIRAARIRQSVGDLDRTLLVVESPELLAGQKRGIAAALKKAKGKLEQLQRSAEAGRVDAETLRRRVDEVLAREHLSDFVETKIGNRGGHPYLQFQVNAKKRAMLERTRLGKRVLCTDRHQWGAERIVRAFRGQWHVEELFRRTKKGGIAAWGPSHQWNDASLRLHTFATVLGLTLVSLARLALRSTLSAKGLMEMLASIEATMVRTTTGAPGRRPTVLLAPELTAEQRRAVEIFDMDRWMPSILSSSQLKPSHHRAKPAIAA